MKIIATADLHGFLPQTPECDVLVVAGDICPVHGSHEPADQLKWLETIFATWLKVQPAKQIVGIAGNHDFVFERWGTAVRELHLPWTYLQDSEAKINGVKFYGLPWVPLLQGWAFYAPEDRLEMAYEAVPDDAQIVVSHGPPLGWGDLALREVHAGAKPALEMIERVEPQAFICGHIHEAHGISDHPHTTVYNASYVDFNYKPGNDFLTIE